MSYPTYIALCGHPLCGKTTAAELLEEIAGYKLVDDGGPMRKMAIEHFGATWEDVYTQEGKLRWTTINGVKMQWRDVLGRLGNALEAQFGGDVIPELAYRAIPEGQLSVFPSVRREQGAYHRARGALVIELVNPGAGPSAFEFDRYNPEHCHVQIFNDFLARGLSYSEARAGLGNALAQLLEITKSGIPEATKAA